MAHRVERGADLRQGRLVRLAEGAADRELAQARGRGVRLPAAAC